MKSLRLLIQKTEYPQTNQTNFNGQYFCICEEEKGFNKTIGKQTIC